MSVTRSRIDTHQERLRLHAIQCWLEIPRALKSRPDAHVGIRAVSHRNVGGSVESSDRKTGDGGHGKVSPDMATRQEPGGSEGEKR